jgi:hypothetical protein
MEGSIGNATRLYQQPRRIHKKSTHREGAKRLIVLVK